MKTLALLGAAILGALGFGNVVQVRDIPSQNTVAVVAWGQDGVFGVRTRVGRDGKIAGEGRAGDHRVYVDVPTADGKGGFTRAVALPNTNLRPLGKEKDQFACKFGACSPMETYGILMPDKLLREAKEDVVIQFRPATGDNWQYTLPHDLIEQYLKTVDSVAASFKK